MKNKPQFNSRGGGAQTGGARHAKPPPHPNVAVVLKETPAAMIPPAPSDAAS